MKSARLIEAEEIFLEELTDDCVSVKFGDQKFVIDMDTLFDLSFRCASFLAFLEHKEEQRRGSTREVLH